VVSLTSRLLYPKGQIKTYKGREAKVHALLTSVLVTSELSDSRSGRFIPGIHYVGGRLGHGADLDTVMAKRKIFVPAGTRTPI